MASQTSIAIAEADAIKRINDALTELAKGKGREITLAPLTGRYPAVLGKDRLVSIANALDAILGRSDVATDTANDADRDTEDAQDETPKQTAPKSTKAKG